MGHLACGIQEGVGLLAAVGAAEKLSDQDSLEGVAAQPELDGSGRDRGAGREREDAREGSPGCCHISTEAQAAWLLASEPVIVATPDT
jgi:hypothetical protein